MLKRLIDIAFSGFAITLLSPLLLTIGLVIALQRDGPILYRGTRVGQFGKTFRMLKFRTMVSDAEKLGGSATANDDTRITKLGAFLRKYKLDEFPQLINVLKGDMSIVGPRPEIVEYVNLSSQEERRIVSVRPGITDWATVWDSDEGALLAGKADPERFYLENIRPVKVKLQLQYVNAQSFWTDLKIIGETMRTVIFQVRPAALELIDAKKYRSGTELSFQMKSPEIAANLITEEKRS